MILPSFAKSHHPTLGQTKYSNTLHDYSPLLPGLEHLQRKIHSGAIQEKNNAIIRDVCLNDSFLSCPCKAHIDFLFQMEENCLSEGINKFIYNLG